MMPGPSWVRVYVSEVIHMREAQWKCTTYLHPSQRMPQHTHKHLEMYIKFLPFVM